MEINELNQDQIDLMISAVLKQGAFLQASCPKEHERYKDVGEKLDRINNNIDYLVKLGLIVELHGEDVNQGVEQARNLFHGFNFRVFSVTPNALLLCKEIMPLMEDENGMPPPKRKPN